MDTETTDTAHQPPEEPLRAAEVGSQVAAILAAAEHAADELRTEAKREVSEVLGRAESDAAARISELTAEAERTRGDAHRKVEELRQEIKLLEDRRERAFQSLRDVAAQLEDVLLRPQVGERADHVESVEVHSALDERA
jgi:cell division septum initiation protein DivIVA